MSRRRHSALTPVFNDVDAALGTVSADELRAVVRDMLLELDEKAHSRVMISLIQRAARSGSGWAPAALSDDEVAEVFAFAKAAERVGHADPSEVDEYLRRGSSAFLRKDYATAHRIFGALLRPIGEGEIDLGQHELVDEVLGADTGECAVPYVVSAYMTFHPGDRTDPENRWHRRHPEGRGQGRRTRRHAKGGRESVGRSHGPEAAPPLWPRGRTGRGLPQV
jgi:hypothetical protein